MADRVLQRHDTAANWQTHNPVLAEGELGIITDGAKGYKIGDGVTAWNDLDYPANPAQIVQELGDSESVGVSQKVVTDVINIQTICWVNKGLNNTGEDLIIDINEDKWLQSNWLDVRLLNKITLNIANTSMFLIVVDNTINVHSSTVKSGHWATIISNSNTGVSDIQNALYSLPFKAAFCRIWIYNSNGIVPTDITDENFSIEYLTDNYVCKYINSPILDKLIKELYVVGASRGTVSLRRIKKQGGSSSDTRGLIIGKVNNTLYNIILENPPRVADKGNNIIKATAGDATLYFLIDWDALEAGEDVDTQADNEVTDNAYTLCTNPQIANYLSAEFHKIDATYFLEGKYVFQDDGSILEGSTYNIYIYPISANRKYRIKGELHGTTTFAIYSDYSSEGLSGLLYIFSKNVNGNVPIDEIIQGYDGYLGVSCNKLNLDVYTDGFDNIFSDVENLQYRLALNTRLTPTGSMPGFIYKDGSYEEHESYTSDSYTLVAGEKYRILGTYQGVKGVAALSFWTDDIFRKTIVNTDAIISSGDTISIDEYFTVPLGINKAYVTNTYGNTLFLYKVDKVDKVDKNAVMEEQLNDAASLSVIAGNAIEPSSSVASTYLNADGNLVENISYTVRRYTVEQGQTFKIKGSTRGTKDVACYALYTTDEATSTNLYSIYTIKDFVGSDFSEGQKATIDHYVFVPEEVVLIVTCSVLSDNDDMLLYDVQNTKDYIDKKTAQSVKYVDCLGDSLTMGATRFGWYEDTLQELLGSDYEVRNWGVGGENTASIMARQGSDCIKFQEEWVLKADGSNTLVMNNDGENILIKTQTYDGTVSLLLQGAENDSEQKTRVVNPCYINGIECTMTYTQGSEFAKGSWYIKRNTVGDRDITIPVNTPVYFNTGKEMGKSDITIIWMGTNDGSYSNWQDLVDKQVMAANKVSNKKFIIIGLHKIGKTAGETYEALMRNTFGNKFFNIREYMCTNMIYDAGITPTDDDLSKMAAGNCPLSLLYDETHLKPASNIALGKMLYGLIVSLGYLS